MFRDFLYFLNAKYQYNKQLEQGLAGLVGIILVLAITWFWNPIFFPFFETLGLVKLIENTGMVGEMPLLTVINVITVSVLILFFIALVFLLLFCFMSILMMTRVGHTLISLLLFPLLLIGLVVMKIKSSLSPNGDGSLEDTYKKNKQLNPTYKKNKDKPHAIRMFNLYKEQIKRTDPMGYTVFITKDKLKKSLNKVSLPLDSADWKFGYDNTEDKWYILFNNPIPEFASSCADIKFRTKYDGLFNFPKQYLSSISNEKSGSGFFVPSLECSFAWNGESIILKESEQMVKVRNTKNMVLYDINYKEHALLFERLKNRMDIIDTTRYAITVFYLIPLVYYDSHFSAKDNYIPEAKKIPNAQKYYSYYRDGIVEQIESYADYGMQWAIDWSNNFNKGSGFLNE